MVRQTCLELSAPAGGAFGAPSPSTGGASPFGASQASNGLFGAAASAPSKFWIGAAATTSPLEGLHAPLHLPVYLELQEPQLLVPHLR